MKKTTFFVTLTLLFVGTTLNSCGKTGCTVRNTQTGEVAADNNCNGIPDFQEWGNGTGTTLVSPRFNFAIVVSPHQTSSLAYRSSGVIGPYGKFLAECYPGTNYVSGQFRSHMIERNGALTMSIANMDILNNLSFDQSAYEIGQLVRNLLTNRTELQKYADSYIPIVTYSYSGVIVGATNYNQATGELSGTAIYCETTGYQLIKVRDAFFLF